MSSSIAGSMCKDFCDGVNDAEPVVRGSWWHNLNLALIVSTMDDNSNQAGPSNTGTKRFVVQRFVYFYSALSNIVLTRRRQLRCDPGHASQRL